MCLFVYGYFRGDIGFKAYHSRYKACQTVLCMCIRNDRNDSCGIDKSTWQILSCGPEIMQTALCMEPPPLPFFRHVFHLLMQDWPACLVTARVVAGSERFWGFPKVSGSCMEVSRIRIIVFWGPYWGPLI